MKLFNLNFELQIQAGWIIVIPNILTAPSLEDAERKGKAMEAEYNLSILSRELGESETVTDTLLESIRSEAGEKGMSYKLTDVSDLNTVEGNDGKIYKISCFHLEGE
jgi:hypothetical protein